MTIVSFEFMLFVAAVVLVYYLVPKKVRWIVLLLGSYVFYWLNSEWLVLALLGTSLVTWLTGLVLQKKSDGYQAYLREHPELTREEKKAGKDQLKKKNRRILVLGILLVLGALLFLKYFNFFG